MRAQRLSSKLTGLTRCSAILRGSKLLGKRLLAIISLFSTISVIAFFVITVQPRDYDAHLKPEEVLQKDPVDYNNNNNNNNNNNVLKVLLFAYFRSGSTLAGQLFNHNPSALYWYEPLAAVTTDWGWFHGEIPFKNWFNHNDGREKSLTDEMTRALVEPLQEIFSCRVNNRLVLGHEFMEVAVATKSYAKCVNDAATIQQQQQLQLQLTKNNRDLLVCRPMLNAACRNSSLLAVKVIRLRMDLVESLLRSDPAIRLIHLVRDPRGMLRSWWTIRKSIVTNGSTSVRTQSHQLELDATLLCRRMLADSRRRTLLERRYPGRTLAIRYEDLATDPERVARQVYVDFLRRIVPAGLLETLRGLLHAEKDDDRWGTKRRNANETAFGWRNELSKPIVDRINMLCAPVLSELRYV